MQTHFSYNAIQLYDLGFGSRIIPVTPPGCDLSPSTRIRAKDRGKAPGILTQSGWTGLDLNLPKFRCADYAQAKLWHEDWGANVGLVAGDGYVVIDNDQGEVFSKILNSLLEDPLRRFVLAEGHTRDSFFLRVLDFIGEPEDIPNGNLVFRNGVMVAKVQILARGKQSVIAGVHPDTLGLYVWNRPLEGLDKIPVTSPEKFEALIKEFIRLAAETGWVLEKTPPIIQQTPVSGVSAPTVSAVDPELSPELSPVTLRALEARNLLDQIPNRDLPPGETASHIDQWLDIYDNWVRVAYALAAHMEPYADTPEALELWLTWSDGRVQAGQDSDTVWRSVLAQPLRYGSIGLLNLVRELVPVPVTAVAASFPMISPDDPILNTGFPIWDEMRARWAFCAGQRGFVDMNSRLVLDVPSFSNKYAPQARDLTLELRPGFFTVKGKGRPPSVPLAASLFLARPDRTEIDGITYAPGDGKFVPDLEHPHLRLFNRWTPTTVRVAPVSEAEIQPWLDHALFVLGDDIERTRFIQWCAFLGQHPRFKPNWHFLILSRQGFGKDTLIKPLKAAVGEGNYTEQLISEIGNNFNDMVENKLIVFGETMQSANSPDYSARLKPLLAQPPMLLSVNKKFRAPYSIPNRCGVLMFSNDASPMHLEPGQRRVHVVNRLGQEARDQAYYLALHEWLEAGGNDKVASYLLSYALSAQDIANFVGGVAPATDTKADLEMRSLNPCEAALEDLIRDARAGLPETPVTLVVTAEELCGYLRPSVRHVTAQFLRGTLLDMERRGTGVRRLRINPKDPNRCGVISDNTYSARLWALAPATATGVDWSTLTNAEIIAIWRGKPQPQSATILRHPGIRFPDDVANEEPI